jgi:hypothetical protein
MPMSARTRAEVLAELPVTGALCFECGNPAHCEHHVVPKSLGGTKTVPLCVVCHGKVHGKDFLKAKFLQAAGIAVARKAGKYKGRQVGTTKAQPERAKELRDLGLSAEEVARSLGVSRNTAFRYLRSED